MAPNRTIAAEDFAAGFESDLNFLSERCANPFTFAHTDKGFPVRKAGNARIDFAADDKHYLVFADEP